MPLRLHDAPRQCHPQGTGRKEDVHTYYLDAYPIYPNSNILFAPPPSPPPFVAQVDSLCVASEMWYFPLLRPFVDHVPVKADLSDLQEKIDWCRQHDDECRTIAANAAALYHEFVSREAILDYMQMVCVEIARRYRHPPAWCAGAPGPAVAPMSRGKQEGECPASCATCQALVDAEKEQQRSTAGKAAAISSQASEENKAAGSKRRDRMLRMAAADKEKAAIAAAEAAEAAEKAELARPPPEPEAMPPPPTLAVKRGLAATEDKESTGKPAAKRGKR